MNKIITLIVFIFYSFPASSSDYSIFYEEDATSVMIIHYEEGEIRGEIISFGGYKWFKATYANPHDETFTFIQPGHLGVTGDAETWMVEKYQIYNMEYLYDEFENNQLLFFHSSDGLQDILGYMSRNEEFSFATLSETSWYAGTFIPVKTHKNLIDLAQLNQRTFCQILEETNTFEGKNIELNTTDLTKLMFSYGLECNENYLLTD